MVTLFIVSDDKPASSNERVVLDIPINLPEQDKTKPEPKAEPTIAEPTIKEMPAPEPKIEEAWQSVEVKSGDNLSTIFRRVGLTPQDVYRISKATKNSKALT